MFVKLHESSVVTINTIRVTRLFILNDHSVITKQLSPKTREQRNFKEDRLMNFEVKKSSDVVIKYLKVMVDCTLHIF